MIEIEEPQEAYQEYPGPILLLAGPGTGKTWQLKMRVKYLIEQRKAKPDEIVVISFTTEAARSMRDRLAAADLALPPESTPSVISTMHSLGNTIVGFAPQMFGLPAEYGVLREDEPREVLLEDATTIAGFPRDHSQSADDCRRKGDCQPDGSEKCRICAEYGVLLRKCAKVDFDDQILLACEALKRDGGLLRLWQARAHYLLVDEYQDINQAQCDLIKLLSGAHLAGLFAVGDDDQSIYSFRGGNPKYIKHFEQYFGEESRIGRLSKSWRCPPNVLQGARGMLRAHYPGGVAKPVPIFDGAAEDARIRFYDVPSDKSEARIVAGLSKKKIKTGSVIIIIPNRKYLPPIEDALRRSGVNFTYKRDPDPGGLVRFAVLADWAEDPDDNIALRYLLDLIVQNNDSLTRKVQADAKTLTAKRLAAQEEIAGLWSGVGGKKSLYRVLCQRAAAENKDSYLASLRSCVDEAMSSLSANGRKREELPVFLQRCGLLVAPGKTPAGIINEVREWRARELSATSSSSYQPVRIYNMPSSKGLEAETVMVIGLSEGLFPKPGADIAENSRLLYVAMTRARKELHLFSARRRPANITFQAQSYQLKSSPFIDAIPAAHILKKYLQSTKK